VNPPDQKAAKVTVLLDAELYVRMVAGAAMRRQTHSRYVAIAIEEALRSQGVFVGTRRRGAGQADLSVAQDQESAEDAA